MKHSLVKLYLLTTLTSSCQSNLFSLAETKDPAEQAVAYMDADQPDDAIDILEAALKDEPENWTYVSLLASAKAQKAGIDTTSIVTRMASENSSGTEGNSLTQLFSVLPEATAARLRLLGEAVELMDSIPAQQRISADAFKASLFSTSYTALQVRFFDSDGSGTFTVDELSTLDESSAIAILSALDSAVSSAISYKTADGSEVSLETIASIRSGIDQQPGATNAEKLKNYLQK